MDNKKSILIVATVFMLIVGIVFVIKNYSIKKENEQDINKTNTVYNEVTNMYYIYNENNELIHSTSDEADLKMYEDNPDYNPNP